VGLGAPPARFAAVQVGDDTRPGAPEAAPLEAPAVEAPSGAETPGASSRPAPKAKAKAKTKTKAKAKTESKAKAKAGTTPEAEGAPPSAGTGRRGRRGAAAGRARRRGSR
jgi:hypothetical protein